MMQHSQEIKKVRLDSTVSRRLRGSGRDPVAADIVVYAAFWPKQEVLFNKVTLDAEERGHSVPDEHLELIATLACPGPLRTAALAELELRDGSDRSGPRWA